jgi:ABC-2 type transport system ATP-binding protein
MIEVKDLTKRYGAILALRGISFSVPRGQVVGFLGPNGAGKTTTMKILTGFLAPTAGTATVAGIDVTADPLPALRRIGYLPTENPLYDELRVVESLRFAAELHGLRGADRDRAVDEAVAAVGLDDRRRQTCGTLSHGYRQRVGLAQALLHRPEVLILDEPTSGLDPNQQQEIRALVRELGRERTVILSTHILPEVEAVCDRAIIIHRGRIVADGGVAEIRGGRTQAVSLVLRGDAARAEGAFQGLEGFASVEVAALPGAPDHVRVRLVGAADRASCERAAARAFDRGLPLSALEPEVASLEQVFRELTETAEEAAA